MGEPLRNPSPLDGNNASRARGNDGFRFTKPMRFDDAMLPVICPTRQMIS
jgi:hypothetical protein